MEVRDSQKVASRSEIRPTFLVAGDVGAIIVVFLLSLIIRFDAFAAFLERLEPCLLFLVVAVCVRVLLSFGFGLYAQMWRHASVREAGQILCAVSLGSIVLAVVNFYILRPLGLPHLVSRGVLVIDWLLNILYLGGSRIALRVVLNWLIRHHRGTFIRNGPSRRILIMGAGDAGATTLRLILSERGLRLVPVGFVDDNNAKLSLRIQNVPVLGNRSDIPRLVQEHHIDEVIIAMPKATSRTVSEIRHICASASVASRALPHMGDLLSGEMSQQQFRDLRVVSNAVPAVPDVNNHEYSNVLVTGGAGFIGANFVRYMLDAHEECRIVVYDKLTYAGNMDNLLGLAERYGERYVFVQGDICNVKMVTRTLDEQAIDTLVNFAAETHVDRSLTTPDAFVRTNIFGTYVLLDAARKFGVKRYHQVSTDEVYGQVLKGSFRETDPLETRSPYSASKASGDLMALAYHASFGLPVTITRGSNNIGPYQYPEKVVPMFVTNAMDDEPLPVYGDGMYERDYQHALDHCRGIDTVLRTGTPGEVYNLGSGAELPAIELAKHILRILGKPNSLIRLVGDRPGQDRRYSLDCSKVRQLGWKPLMSFEESLEDTVQWYVKNEWWWRKIKSGEYRGYFEEQYRKRLDDAVESVLTE